MVTLSLHNQKRLLQAITLLLVAGAIACALLLIFLPLSLPTNNNDKRTASSNNAGDINATQASLQSYTEPLGRDLRYPLYDPKPIQVKAAPPPKPVLKAKLVGTVLEPGFTYAIFTDASGKQTLVPVGQSIEGAEVLEIADGKAVVKFCGETITLMAQKETGQ